MDRIPDLFPMGAVNDEKKLELAWTSDKFVVERKMDGSRALLRHDLDGSVAMTSRVVSVKTGRPTNKVDRVPHLADMIRKVKRGTIIDGEIITHINCTSSEVAEILGALPEKAIERQKEQGYVKFFAYDILWYDGQDLTGLTWEQRRKYLEKVVENEIGLEDDNIILSNYFECDKFDAQKWYRELVASGAEGVVLKNKKAKYQSGTDKMKKPANTFLKAKKHDTYDVILTGYLPPEKYYTGKELERENGTWRYWINENTGEKIEREAKVSSVPRYIKPITKFYFHDYIGSVEFSQYAKDGELVVVGSTSGFDDDTRKYISEHQEELLGTTVEIGGMERIAKSNSIRHPFFVRFRDDKPARECII